MLLSRVVKTSRATTLQKKNTISQPRLNADADDTCTTGGSSAACTGLGVAFGPGEKSLERGAAVGAGSWGGRGSWRQPLGWRCVRLVLRVWEAFWQVTRLVHDVGLRVPANDINLYPYHCAPPCLSWPDVENNINQCFLGEALIKSSPNGDCTR